jgi:hypothetical protein
MLFEKNGLGLVSLSDLVHMAFRKIPAFAPYLAPAHRVDNPRLWRVREICRSEPDRSGPHLLLELWPCPACHGAKLQNAVFHNEFT